MLLICSRLGIIIDAICTNFLTLPKFLVISPDPVNPMRGLEKASHNHHYYLLAYYRRKANRLGQASLKTFTDCARRRVVTHCRSEGCTPSFSFFATGRVRPSHNPLPDRRRIVRVPLCRDAYTRVLLFLLRRFPFFCAAVQAREGT